jgi:ribosomal protein L24E
MSPTVCEFCGAPIRDGQRFAIVAKDKTWTAFFCSNYCAAGWGVVRLIQPSRGAADAERPPLSDRHGEHGVWWRDAGPHG